MTAFDQLKSIADPTANRGKPEELWVRIKEVIDSEFFENPDPTRTWSNRDLARLSATVSQMFMKLAISGGYLQQRDMTGDNSKLLDDTIRQNLLLFQALTVAALNQVAEQSYEIFGVDK